MNPEMRETVRSGWAFVAICVEHELRRHRREAGNQR
jgi:hypothetical protein